MRDNTYLLDFFEHQFETSEKENVLPKEVANFIVTRLRNYSLEHGERFMGLAMAEEVHDRFPTLCSRLWHELDLVPIALREGAPSSTFWSKYYGDKMQARGTDELAESMARRCLRWVCVYF